MNYFEFSVGVVVFLIGFLDMVSSTLGLGGGFVARRLIRYLWWPAVWVSERFGGGAKLLRPWGMNLNLLMLLSWIVMITTGWFLVFSSSEQAVLDQQTQRPESAVGRLQYTVSTLSGLGRGLSQAGESDMWTVLAVLASLAGTFVISFAISFLIPILQAATNKRALAHRISLLGESPLQILETYCENGSSDALQSELRELLQEFIRVYEQHRTYPSVHLLFSSHRFDNMALNLVILDEAISVLRFGFPDMYLARPSIFEPIRKTMTRMLEDLHSIYVDQDITEIPTAGVDSQLVQKRVGGTVDEESFRKIVEDESFQERRRKLTTLLRNNGWTWKDVYSPDNREDKEDEEPLEASEEDV